MLRKAELNRIISREDAHLLKKEVAVKILFLLDSLNFNKKNN